VKILAKTPEQLNVQEIAQFKVQVNQEANKFKALMQIYSQMAVSQAVVFCNTKNKVENLTKKLQKAKFPAAEIHGDLGKKERDQVINKFRTGKIRILVATDIVGRGLDVQQVSLVICYDLPALKNKEVYLHRIGRSGRFGRKGVAINFVTPDDAALLKQIEQHYQTSGNAQISPQTPLFLLLLQLEISTCRLDELPNLGVSAGLYSFAQELKIRPQFLPMWVGL
jgi:ATP-dependent RNA helicase